MWPITGDLGTFLPLLLRTAVRMKALEISVTLCTQRPLLDLSRLHKLDYIAVSPLIYRAADG